MDDLESNITDNSLQQKGKKIKKSPLEKTIFRFTCFQIGIVALQLAFAIPELTSGTFFLFVLASMILVPIFIISVFIEIITIVIIKTTHKAGDTKTQDLSFASVQYNTSNKDTDIFNQKHQTKRLKSSTKALIVLFSMIGITILLVTSNVFIHRYHAISDAFSREEEILNDSPYHVEIIKKDPINGVMTVKLDDNIVFDYICEVNPGGINTGYGPFCSRHFSDGSHSIGEYIFNKNYSFLQRLLTKYRDTLVVDDANNKFKVIKQGKLKMFFSDLIQNTDFNKAYMAFKSSDPNDLDYLNNLNYIYVGGTGLFWWAYRNFE